MMRVEKYGGSLVRNPADLQALAALLAERQARGERLIIVLSAYHGETDRLFSLVSGDNARSLFREKDAAAVNGELVSTAVLYALLLKHQVPAALLAPHQLGIITDSDFGRAHVLRLEPRALRQAIENSPLVVVPGFQGRTQAGEPTTLGRGGSDLTAVLLAGALQCSCDIVKDVDGVFPVDPYFCPGAMPIPALDYKDMLTLCEHGAKVIQKNAVQVAHKFSVPLTIRGMKSIGTSITSTAAPLNGVLCLASRRQYASLQIESSSGEPELLQQISALCTSFKVNPDHITRQPVPGGGWSISLSMPWTEQVKALFTCLKKEYSGKGWKCRMQDDLALISVITAARAGIELEDQATKVLLSAGIRASNVRLASGSLQVAVAASDLPLALQNLHSAFFASTGQNHKRSIP